MKLFNCRRLKYEAKNVLKQAFSDLPYSIGRKVKNPLAANSSLTVMTPRRAFRKLRWAVRSVWRQLRNRFRIGRPCQLERVDWFLGPREVPNFCDHPDSIAPLNRGQPLFYENVRPKPGESYAAFYDRTRCPLTMERPKADLLTPEEETAILSIEQWYRDHGNLHNLKEDQQ